MSPSAPTSQYLPLSGGQASYIGHPDILHMLGSCYKPEIMGSTCTTQIRWLRMLYLLAFRADGRELHAAKTAPGHRLCSPSELASGALHRPDRQVIYSALGLS